MRLDKFLANSGIGTRKEVKEIIKNKQIKINDIVEIKFGDQTSKFKITAIPTKQSVRTDEVAEMID